MLDIAEARGVAMLVHAGGIVDDGVLQIAGDVAFGAAGQTLFGDAGDGVVTRAVPGRRRNANPTSERNSRVYFQIFDFMILLFLSIGYFVNETTRKLSNRARLLDTLVGPNTTWVVASAPRMRKVKFCHVSPRSIVTVNAPSVAPSIAPAPSRRIVRVRFVSGFS